MKGNLKLIVLSLLAKKDYNGYGLLTDSAKYHGKRPSTGTIYPLLTDLEDLKLVKSIECKGKRKEYKLTSKGRKHIQVLIKSTISDMNDTNYILREFHGQNWREV